MRNFTCSYPVIKNSRQRLDILLGKDLSEKLDRIAAPGTGVLVYEIQHQYYSHCHFYSMDAIVGSEFQNALMKRETLSEFYKRCGIKYVVTMDAMNYRKIFDNTAFETLYSFDKNAMVGERVLIDGVFYTKILHNDTPTVPMVTPNLNDQADTLDVFPEDSVWPGSSLFWNAVYRVEVRR